MRLLFAALLLVSAAHALAQEGQAVCKRVAAKVDQSELWDKPKGCQPMERYYALRDKPGATAEEWRAVRDCAAAEGSDGVLAMIHANGFGTPRDLQKATLHTCGMWSAPAELDGRIERLARMARDSKPAVFDICDDATSGMTGGLCAGIDESRKKRQRQAAMGGLREKMPELQRKRFDALLDANEAFARHRSDMETDMSGTARASMAIIAAMRARDTLAADLRDAEAGKFPQASKAAFANADAELNAVYRRVMKQSVDKEARFESSTVTKADVKATQRSWLAYRDAWTAFAALRYPQVPAEAWKARLTLRRIAQLKVVAP
jgi:uncharacterized protein YecT (DUF1311 family)